MPKPIGYYLKIILTFINMSNNESTNRSIIKSISWRIIATLVTTALVFIFTGKLDLALQVGVFEVFLKMLIYYFHERIWNNIKWGNK